ncbi:MAG: ExbD/TolR family protein [Rhodomicrobiaceae bacterium]
MGANLPQGHFDDGDDLPPMAEINVTPFVDVMLVLLIIFMVTAPLMLGGVHVDMPKTSAARSNPPQKPLVVSMSAEADLYIRDEQVTRATLVPRLAELYKSEKDSVVYVKADRAIPYGSVMELLGEIAGSGFSRISLLSEREPGATN